MGLIGSGKLALPRSWLTTSFCRNMCSMWRHVAHSTDTPPVVMEFYSHPMGMMELSSMRIVRLLHSWLSATSGTRGCTMCPSAIL